MKATTIIFALYVVTYANVSQAQPGGETSTIYATSSQGVLQIDAATGAWQASFLAGVNALGIDLGVANTFLITRTNPDGSAVATINPATDQRQDLSDETGYLEGAFLPTGEVLVAQMWYLKLFDPLTNAVTVLKNGWHYGVAVDASAGLAFVGDRYSQIWVYDAAIRTMSDAPIYCGDQSTTFFAGFAVDPETRTIYCANNYWPGGVLAVGYDGRGAKWVIPQDGWRFNDVAIGKLNGRKHLFAAESTRLAAIDIDVQPIKIVASGLPYLSSIVTSE